MQPAFFVVILSLEAERDVGFPLFNRLQRRQYCVPDGEDFGFAAARPFRTVRAELHHDARVASVPFPYQHVFVALPFDQLFRAGHAVDVAFALADGAVAGGFEDFGQRAFFGDEVAFEQSRLAGLQYCAVQHFQTHVGLLGKAYGGVGFEGFAAVVGDEASDQADAALVRHFVFLPFAQAFEEVGTVSFLHAVEHFFFFRLPVGGFFAVIGGDIEIAADDVGVVLIEFEYHVGFVGHAVCFSK